MYQCIKAHYNPEIDRHFNVGESISYIFFRKFIYGDLEYEGKFKIIKHPKQ